MTRLQEILQEYNITTYRVCKLMNRGTNSHSRIRNIINGSSTVEYNELRALCSSLSKYIDKEITPEMLEYKVDRVRL
jgi:hypothetical protein